MNTCKRIELIIEQSQLSQIERLLHTHEIDAYTLIPDVGGKGDRGYRRGNELTDATSNCIFIIAIEDQNQLAALMDDVRPVLTQFGGMCIISEGQFLIH